MEFDQNLIFNFASVVATLLFVSAASITIFRRLKLRWPVKVNCWFCNNYTKIYRSELDWWQCPSCEQYNGFTKDGDYAYDIPEQSMEMPKNFAKSPSKRRKTKRRRAKNNLCERCNRNEEHKIFELQMFEPKGFFDNGLENFKRDLEMRYPLCDDCKILVKNVLQKQSLWLTRYKMLFYKQKSVSAIINNAEKLEKIVRILLTILTSVMMFYPNYWPLPFFGAFLQFIAFVINEAHRSSDAILALLWICTSLVGPLNKIDLFELHEYNKWPSLENLTGHHFATILTLIIGIANATARYRSARSIRASFKKLETLGGNENPFSRINEDSFEDFVTDGETMESQTYSNYRPTPTNDTEIALRKKTANTFRKREDERKIVSSEMPCSVITNDNSETGSRHILKFDGDSEQFSLNDSLSTLRTLTLGESRMGQTAGRTSIFRTRIYGSTSPDLFHRTRKSTRKIILAPPKLKSFAQTSWVAGGYWQIDTPSLSRSSSQSSGFGSAGSNFGPSREPSVTKDIDRCSVITDNGQFCCAPPQRPSSVNSINSCCRHGSPIQFGRCENSLYNESLKIIPNAIFLANSQTHFSPIHPDSNGCYEHCLSLKNGNIKSSTIPTSQQNYPTVLRSTVLLTILLGGSLVFNIAIFCTIILR